MRCGSGLGAAHCQLGPLLVCRDGPVVGLRPGVAALMKVREL